jgi:large subunit ribosomal protein L18
MSTKQHAKSLFDRRRARVRSRISRSGTTRLRLSVFRSSKHIYAQVIDDDQKKTLVATSDQKFEKAGKDEDKKSRAKKVGADIAAKCKEKGIDKVVFDRAGYKYHGRVSALATGAREAGLKF